ncbi:hypothetical protein KPL71_027215 [Citrus sinensis]|uniref:Uncharacterized protein n=1 Tax=Citrus sinensis TaxID=2711 RepID=A0ACB8I6J0_CITSI|nr:hypothetical protein KPL71_027215 [Citrus sinensis]
MEDQTKTKTKTKTKDKEASGSGLGKTVMSPYFLSVQHEGTNYDEWARDMRTALHAKKKFGFVDGIVKQPADDSADLEDWWVVNSMNGSLLAMDHVRNNSNLSWQIASSESHILSTESLLKLNRACAIVILKEQVQSMTRAKEEQSEHIGHEASSCFQLIGYPEWWGKWPKAMRNAGCGRGNSRQNGGNNGRGRGGPARANAAQVATGSNSPSEELLESAASGLSGLSSEQWNTLLNLLNSKKDSTSRISGKLNSMEWILDTGASHHMTGKRKNLMRHCIYYSLFYLAA